MVTRWMQVDDEMISKSLTELSNNQEAEIEVINGGWIMQTRLKALGIFVGQKIKKISRAGMKGPVIILVDRAQVAIGAGMACRIGVKAKS
jgi:ferrous iron transport protein A